MPKLTDARRQLRREQILEAAQRCFLRSGMERTSIADITAESGLSAGSIYAHFANKAELLQAAAHELLARRTTMLTELAESATPPSPEELLDHLAAAIDADEARVGLQVWGEATTDPAMRDIVVTMTERMRTAVAVTCEAWLTKVHKHESDDVHPRAAALSDQVMATYQALLLRSALFDDRPPPAS